MALLSAIIALSLLFCAEYCVACRDGWGSPGECVKVSKCPAVVSMISSPSVQTEILDRLRHSVCVPSVRTREVHICCALANESATTDTRQVTTTPSVGRSVTTHQLPPLNLSQYDPKSPEGHKNRHLLPHPLRCGIPDLSDRIVGGREADMGEFPWIALIAYEGLGPDSRTFDYYSYDTAYDDDLTYSDDNNITSSVNESVSFNCGASLISRRYVLTAAHCIPTQRSKAKIAFIRFGEHDLNTPLDCQEKRGRVRCADAHVDIKPENIITHKRYNLPFINRNDIALIRLSRDVFFTAFIQPICLPFGESWRNDMMKDRKVTVAGFGLTEALGKLSNVLMKVTISVVNNTYCAAKLRSLRSHVGNRQVCAEGAPGKDSCEGDSGGPLMAHGGYGPPIYIYGVVSFGMDSCGQFQSPAVYTRVSSYLNWILKRLRP